MMCKSEGKMNTIITPEDPIILDDIVMIKSAFETWLSERHQKKCNIDGFLFSLDKTSEQLIKRKLLNKSLWEISNHSVFADVYNKAMNDKLLRIADRKTHSIFVKAGRLYLKFLKLKPNLFREKTITQKESLNYIENWKIENEKGFKTWLKKEQYSQKTADNYCRAVLQIFRDYPIQYQKAFIESNSKIEGIHKLVDLLNEVDSFVLANKTRHNQFSASLAALKRYYILRYNEHVSNSNQNENLVENSTSIIDLYLNEIIDLEEGKICIRQILNTHFQALYGYSNISILWNAVQDSLSMFINDNAINNANDLWSFMNQAFVDEYILNFPHIWKTSPNYPQSYVGVIINLARQFNGTVTREQINDYFARIKQSPPINSTIIRQGLLAFYANKHFILTEVVELTNERCAAISKSLERLFVAEKVPYIVLRDITNEWFASLPSIKNSLPWTPLLLQEAMRLCTNIGYKVVFSGLNGQSLDTLGVAIVSNESEINTFADVVHHFCYERGLLSKKMHTEDLRIILRDAGMLDGNELVYNLHKTFRDYRFAFTDENKMVRILEK